MNACSNARLSSLADDPWLDPYRDVIRRRQDRVAKRERGLTRGKTALADFASGHEHYGLHRAADGWVLREWAPNAQGVFNAVGCEHEGCGLVHLRGDENLGPGRIPIIRLRAEPLDEFDLFGVEVECCKWNAFAAKDACNDLSVAPETGNNDMLLLLRKFIELRRWPMPQL